MVKKLRLILLLSVISVILAGCKTNRLTVEESSQTISASVIYETPVEAGK